MRDALMNMIVYQGDTEFASANSSATCSNRSTDWTAKPSPRDDRRDAPRLASVPIDDHLVIQEKLKRKKCWSACLENQRLLGAFMWSRNGWISHLYDLSIVTAIPVADVEVLGFCSTGRSMSYMLREEASTWALAMTACDASSKQG